MELPLLLYQGLREIHVVLRNQGCRERAQPAGFSVHRRLHGGGVNRKPGDGAGDGVLPLTGCVLELGEFPLSGPQFPSLCVEASIR